MHPNELKDQALVAAAMAEHDGFTATAGAFKLMATVCATESRELLKSKSSSDRKISTFSTQDSCLHLGVLF